MPAVRLLVPGHYRLVKGGIGSYARGVLAALGETAPAGTEVVVPALPRDRHALGRIGSLGGGVARLRYEQGTLRRAAARADLVFLSDARAILSSPTPFVMTVHDVSYLDHPAWFSRGAALYKRAMLAAALRRRPAAIVCDSAYGRDRLLAHHPEAAELALEVVPPGVAPPSAPAPEPLAGEPYFLTVGTLEPRKNYLGLLAVFRRARAAGLALRWRVIGAPGHRSAPIVAALSRSDGVDLMGEVDEPTLDAAYRGATFVAAPSHAEGFGFPPLEAMARGVPVICSTGSAFDEVVAGAALQAPAEDEGAWADALLQLERGPGLCKDLSAAGRERAARYTWATTASRLHELFGQVADTPAGAAKAVGVWKASAFGETARSSPTARGVGRQRAVSGGGSS